MTEYWLDWLGCLWVGKSARGFYLRFDGHSHDGYCLWDPEPLRLWLAYEQEGFEGYTYPQLDWTPCTKERAEAMIEKFRKEAMAR